MFKHVLYSKHIVKDVLMCIFFFNIRFTHFSHYHNSAKKGLQFETPYLMFILCKQLLLTKYTEHRPEIDD